MHFGLSGEQEMIRDGFARMLADNCDVDRLRAASARTRAGRDAADTALCALMREMGLYGLMVPHADGGAGLGLFEAAVVAIELGRAAAPVPFTGAVMATVAAQTKGGRDIGLGQKIADGQAIGVSTDRTLLRGGETLSGQVPHVIDGGGAESFLLTDRSGGCHLIHAGDPGVTVEPVATIDGTQSVANLSLEGTPVRPICRTGEIPDRMRTAGRIVLAAQATGAAEHMLAASVAYAGERHQFGRPIGSFQAVKHMCAEMAAEVVPLAALVWHAAYAFDHRPQEAQLQACLAKSHVDEAGRFVARTATEVHGGMGFADLPGLHHWYKRIGFCRAHFGAPEQLRAEAADIQDL